MQSTNLNGTVLVTCSQTNGSDAFNAAAEQNNLKRE
jgi:hypothetical protein